MPTREQMGRRRFRLGTGGEAGTRLRQAVLRRIAGAAIVLACCLDVARAGEPMVVSATATLMGGTWNFDVTVQHADEGWEHYADAWRVVGPDGTVYGTRELFHPHVDEQPFTRSLAGVAIPDGVTQVTIEAHDLVHGWGGPFALQLRP